MTLRAATDFVRTFASAIVAPRIPLYGHLVVARSALEASVVSLWLNEAATTPLDRIKRGLCERLYSAHEVARLQVDAPGGATTDQLADVAERFGWDVRMERGRPVVDGARRPSVPHGIARAVTGNAQTRIGRLLWSRLSAVTHVTWFGLAWAFQLDEVDPPTPGMADMTSVALGSDARTVETQAFCILSALRAAASERFTLMGWHDDEWGSAVMQAEAFELQLLRAIVG